MINPCKTEFKVKMLKIFQVYIIVWVKKLEYRDGKLLSNKNNYECR